MKIRGKYKKKDRCDLGGGVGGLLYASNLDGSDLNYKHYNLRGDVVQTTDNSGVIQSSLYYTAFGAMTTAGTSPADSFRNNTKYRDAFGIINEGFRCRPSDSDRFLTPDPLEYIDGLNPCLYCSQNPWGRFDALGLFEGSYTEGSNFPTIAKHYGTNFACVEIFATAKISSDSTKLQANKDYTIACTINFEYKNSAGENIKQSFNVARYARAGSDSKITNEEFKLYNENSYSPVLPTLTPDGSFEFNRSMHFQILDGTPEANGYSKINTNVAKVTPSEFYSGSVSDYKKYGFGTYALSKFSNGDKESNGYLLTDAVQRNGRVVDSGSLHVKQSIKFSDPFTCKSTISGKGHKGSLSVSPTSTDKSSKENAIPQKEVEYEE